MKKLFLMSAAGLLFFASCKTYCPAYGQNEAPKSDKAQATAAPAKSTKAQG